MFKRHMMTGVLVWVPILVTIAVIRFVLGILANISNSLPVTYHPNSWLGWNFPGIEWLVVLVFVWMTGVLASNVIGRYVIALSESLLAKIPLVHSVYHGVKQAMSVVFSDSGSDRFSQVLLVQYPREGLWTLAFVTNDALSACSSLTGKKMLTIFVPTTPIPTSGFVFMVPEEDTKPIDLSVDDALKYIISLGTVVPVADPLGE